jgi:DNA-directed RNA polymerase beta' subunit
MSIYRVIDKLEAYVREGTWLPAGMRILSEERLMEFVEKMRSTLPEEVGRAKTISSNRERVIKEAQERAQQIVSEASAAHQQLVDENEIVRRARTTAETVLREAEEKAMRIRQGADQYAAQVLTELEARLNTALGSVKKGQEALVPRPSKAEPLAEAAAASKRAAVETADTAHDLAPVEAQT